MGNEESFFVVINPSSTDIGYSVWRNAELFKHGTFKAIKNDDENVILEKFFNDITQLLKDYPPTLIAYKELSKTYYTRPYLLLQGMLMALCVQNHIFFKLVSDWKKDLGIKGRKDQTSTLAVKYVKEHYAEKLKGVEAEAVCIGSSFL